MLKWATAHNTEMKFKCLCLNLSKDATCKIWTQRWHFHKPKLWKLYTCRDAEIYTLNKFSPTNRVNQTHRGICGLVPVWDGHMVVEHFARNPLFDLGFPQNRVEIGEVMVNVYSVIAPSTQRPTAELWTLCQRKSKRNTIRRKFRENESRKSY